MVNGILANILEIIVNKEKQRLILFNKQKGKCCKCGKVLGGSELSREVDGVVCLLPCGYEEWKRSRGLYEKVN